MTDKLADRIRNFVNETIIIPRRLSAIKKVEIRVGDIANAMNLNNRVPAICGALQTKKFEELTNVKKIGTKGPGNGMNCIITFELLG